jgi:hypothetical protein
VNSTQRECSGPEFAVGSLRGVRTWSVDRLGRLTGVSYTQVWTPGENTASCRIGDLGGLSTSGQIIRTVSPLDDPVVQTMRSLAYAMAANAGASSKTRESCSRLSPDCTCGFYAYHDGVADYHPISYCIEGIIDGYGLTTVGTRGFRCEKARIVALLIRDSDRRNLPRCSLVERNYPDVPVFRKRKQMLAAFPCDNGGLVPSPANDPDFWTRSVL